jgi:hypothetical protein
MAKWDGIWQRLFELEDDGHASKLGRAVAYGEIVCKEYENEEWVKVKGDMWQKIGNMVVDSVQDTGEKWARSVGFEEAWAAYKDRDTSNQARI